MSESTDTCGVAVVRVWREEGRTLIRIIGDPSCTDADNDNWSFVTNSVDDALEHLRRFIDP